VLEFKAMIREFHKAGIESFLTWCTTIQEKETIRDNGFVSWTRYSVYYLADQGSGRISIFPDAATR